MPALLIIPYRFKSTILKSFNQNSIKSSQGSENLILIRTFLTEAFVSCRV